MAEIKVTGIILAGGMGRRMGGEDKGLLPFRGKPLIAHVIERLSPQVDELLINANREIARYDTFGLPVVADAIADFAGPLAGLQRGMSLATHPLVVTAPCDAPFLPTDLVQRLADALERQQADIAVAQSGGRMQPVFCLCRAALLPNLTLFLQQGGRKVALWQAGLHCIEVPFDDASAAFANINTPEELACLEK